MKYIINALKLKKCGPDVCMWEKYHRRWRQHRAVTVETVDAVDTVENVDWMEWSGLDTPQSVMTTRAPAVLKIGHKQ